jgi:hypothetical protein
VPPLESENFQLENIGRDCNGKNVKKINGLGKDLSESGCEDQPLNERTTLQRTNKIRRN